MPSASLATLRRALVVLLVLGALFGAAPGVQECEGRTVASVEGSMAPEPSNEGVPDAADAVLPVQPGRIARPDRPTAVDAGRPEPAPTPATPNEDARRPATATGVRCVVLRC
ncbi:hypothetical protein ACIOUE_13220 [Streptomyces xanthochromogenes]|uniref:hypothetical protein n=1 Tax=Streptomyces xanthochromogenes TaxID=67384 RepID=UPI0034192D13